MKKTQALLETAVLSAIIVLALVAMFVMMRNAFSGRFKQAADTYGGGEQYSPGRTIVTEEHYP